jgi:hypothetical protein
MIYYITVGMFTQCGFCLDWPVTKQQALVLVLAEYYVTNLLCPPSNTAENGSIATLKRRARDFANQQTTRDDRRISYLGIAEEHNYDTLMLARMLAQ